MSVINKVFHAQVFSDSVFVQVEHFPDVVRRIALGSQFMDVLKHGELPSSLWTRRR